MGECKYCHKDAGWFSSKHSDCEDKYNIGVTKLKAIIRNCFEKKEDFFLHKSETDRICADSYIGQDFLISIYRELLEEAVNKYLNDGVIEKNEETCIARFIQFSGFTQKSLNTTHALDKVVQSRVIQEILKGNVPKPAITISGDFPFMLSKNETLIWMFRNIILHEQKTRREYTGRSSGFNIRVAKGIYYRTGGFKGTPVETSYMQRISEGSVCLTDKNLYFSSMEKSLKIPYDKIISIESYSNGLGLQKDGANSKPVFFERLDSWFCYNVISNLK